VNCALCGKEFTRARQWPGRTAKYCSKTCSGKVNSRFAYEASRRPVADRFWEKVERAGAEDCWLWQGAVDGHGYGSIGLSEPRRTIGKAHRVSWELANGPIPPGLGVLHKCDTPLCVNPAHLFLGTNTENTADKTFKGRAARKINTETAKQIFVIQKSTKEIAQMFGVSVSLVGQIKRGTVWSHVTRGL
jgi:hypothetical protein